MGADRVRGDDEELGDLLRRVSVRIELQHDALPGAELVEQTVSVRGRLEHEAPDERERLRAERARRTVGGLEAQAETLRHAMEEGELLRVGAPRRPRADEEEADRLAFGDQPLAVEPDEAESAGMGVLGADREHGARVRDRQLLEAEPANVAKRNADSREQMKPVGSGVT